MNDTDLPRPDLVPDGDLGVFQDLVDALFRNGRSATRRDLVLLAELQDASDDVLEVVELMPPGTYTRAEMADQMNSIITAHGWGMRYGTVG